MDYKYKSVDESLPQQHQPPPYRQQHQSSTLTYFTQQAIRVSAGYMAPHSGNALDHFQHQPTNLHEAMRREIENPTIMREAIMREIEKERIREEIIAEEMARRRMLEYEVRRELLMERQLAKLSGEGFSPFPSPVMSFSPTLPFLKQQSDAGCTEERIARSLEGRMGKEISVSGLGARNEIRRLDIVPFEERISEIPFQQRSVEPKVSALKPVSHSVERMLSELQPSLEPSKEKDRIILLGLEKENPDGSFDLLEWWKAREKHFPVLARMARDILSIQASTVASESAFSQARLQIGDHRASMRDSLEKSVLFRDWIRSERRNFGIAEAQPAIDEAYEEMIAELTEDSASPGSGDEQASFPPPPTQPPPNLEGFMRFVRDNT
ncbi:uncharacterized protein LOC107759834 isoform X3 [Nicotiana tabacum]|uniref:Uncharacterized protein LOC107759834 isoform X3 n=1 Tax=Nicotiana tabacum TaxID=4097 RepID=A0AC58T674_TOBAC